MSTSPSHLEAHDGFSDYLCRENLIFIYCDRSEKNGFPFYTPVINMRRLVLNSQPTISAGYRFDQAAMKHKDKLHARLKSNGQQSIILAKRFFLKQKRVIVKLPCYQNVNTNSKGFWLHYAHTHSDAVLLLSESVD